MWSRIKEYIGWCSVTFTGAVALLSLMPIGINGESALLLLFPEVFYVLIMATAFGNLIHLFKPNTYDSKNRN